MLDEYLTYQHVYLNNLLRKDNSVVKKLIINGHGVASCSGDLFSTIHGDMATEHFKKKRRELLGLFPHLILLKFIYAVNKWIKTSYIHNKVPTILWNKLNVFTSQVLQKITPGNKGLHFEHAQSLKANLKQCNVNIFRNGSTRNLTTQQTFQRRFNVVFRLI